MVCMQTTRTTFTVEESLVQEARRLGVNVSAAARKGVSAAVRVAQAAADRAAYELHPEVIDEFWSHAEARARSESWRGVAGRSGSEAPSGVGRDSQ